MKFHINVSPAVAGCCRKFVFETYSDTQSFLPSMRLRQDAYLDWGIHLELFRRALRLALIFYKSSVPVLRAGHPEHYSFLWFAVENLYIRYTHVEMHFFVICVVASGIALALAEPLPGACCLPSPYACEQSSTSEFRLLIFHYFPSCTTLAAFASLEY